MSSLSCIQIKNAHQNNLKNIDLDIPHNKLVVITGVSGSGKSSLAFETLYEEGRRRYVESLSSYVRQFIGKIQKPKVDLINGLPPAIAIEQKRSTSNSRSTVGTVTEIYHYLQILFARVGKIYSPVSGNEVKRHSVDFVVNYILQQNNAEQINILAPLTNGNGRKLSDELAVLMQKGFVRIVADHQVFKISDLLDKLEKGEKLPILKKESELFILVDRIVPDPEDEELAMRISDSVQTAFFEGHGNCVVEMGAGKQKSFSNRLELDGIEFEESTPDMFSFNSPYGACPECGGFGEKLGIDEQKVIPNPNLSLYDGAVICWEGEKMKKWKNAFIKGSSEYNFPIFTPYNELNEEQRNLLWYGNEKIDGIYRFFTFIEENTYKVHYRIFLSRFKGRTYCHACKGTRLRKEALYVKVNGKTIGELLLLPLEELLDYFRTMQKSDKSNKIISRLMPEIMTRLQMLNDIGLGYLTLNRTSRTLSGGELQRIQLVYSLGSNLTGSLYILDEPSIGLHPRDTFELIIILKRLRDLGNTVVVVEHDEDIIRSADILIDLGPDAGTLGGKMVFAGELSKINIKTPGYTAAYLAGKLSIPVSRTKIQSGRIVEIKGARKHNLQNINIQFPVSAMTVVTGVSGSGKSSLVRDVIFDSLKTMNEGTKANPVYCDNIEIDYELINRVEYIGQHAIDGNRRSNPATYMKVFDQIRETLAGQPLAKASSLKPAHFSFNVEGGRCETCKGDGEILVEMQFVADLHLLCEDCKGKRYKDEVLEVEYNGKNIYDILNMTVAEATEFFYENKAIVNGLKPLMQVGLDYLQLGQSTSTLSGGEGQRLKLASFLNLSSRDNSQILFLFDEPTTGLHWHDISKLLDAFRALIDKGHTVLVIEHNMEVVKNADYLIDLGPEGGNEGGHVVFQGVPEEILKSSQSYTARFLERKI